MTVVKVHFFTIIIPKQEDFLFAIFHTILGHKSYHTIKIELTDRADFDKLFVFITGP